MNLILYAVLAAAVVFVDLLTKHFVKISEALAQGSVEIIPGVFRLTYVENPGAAMGSFSENRWVFMILSLVAMVAIAVYAVRHRRELSPLLGVALSLILGGGAGNMYERLFNQNAAGQYVATDFFDFYLFPFWKWVFNVADVAVCVGAGLVILYLVRELIREYRGRAAAAGGLPAAGASLEPPEGAPAVYPLTDRCDEEIPEGDSRSLPDRPTGEGKSDGTESGYPGGTGASADETAGAVKDCGEDAKIAFGGTDKTVDTDKTADTDKTVDADKTADMIETNDAAGEEKKDNAAFSAGEDSADKNSADSATSAENAGGAVRSDESAQDSADGASDAGKSGENAEKNAKDSACGQDGRTAG